MDILITDKIDEICIQTLQEKYKFNVTFEDINPIGFSSIQLKHIIDKYDGLIVRSRTIVNREIIKLGAEGNLKVIGRAGMGMDNIDLETAKEFEVKVFNVIDGHIYSVAEHTIGLMIALSRHIIQAHNSTNSGKWEKSQFKGNELYGKILGIVGYGQTGQQMAKIAETIGMEIFVYDPYSIAENMTYVSLQTMFKTCDFVTLHVPLNSETENMINSELLKNSKHGLKIINTSRGKVIDEAALVSALESEWIAGAALDVFSKEPAIFSPFRKFDNVIMTPHIASSTVEAQKRIAEKIADKIGLHLLSFKNNEKCEHGKGKMEYCMPCDSKKIADKIGLHL